MFKYLVLEERLTHLEKEVEEISEKSKENVRKLTYITVMANLIFSGSALLAGGNFIKITVQSFTQTKTQAIGKTAFSPKFKVDESVVIKEFDSIDLKKTDVKPD